MFHSLFLVNLGGIIALLIVLFIALIVVATSFKIVPQANAYIIERLGSYHTTWGTGLHFLIPFIYRVAKKISLKEQVIDFDPQPVITKDNVTMQIDTVIFFTITDGKAYAYGVENPLMAIEKLTATTLRNIIGELDLDGTLTSRDIINVRMRDILDVATDPWGIKVNRVELKNILPPKDIRDAMEKQMRAERERREAILRAEGEKRAAILQAEGFKESTILQAEAKRQALINEAEGRKEAQVLEAIGEAQAILEVQTAKAKSIELIRKAGADQAVLTIKAYEALAEMANGQATKIIVPSNLQGLAGTLASLVEVAKDK
ncbi:MAG TPA: SPFH domain-containing protein [Bacilli bacterium]|nr:MAG: Modulator of FtsH protease HflC [Tenericutes bacterium ADurb.BinA124]HNZ49973.1 SPFH domain-containing protein [Bacilli bacterium]HOH17839.1 SPFH domain-containing protein [Bacilli bacterium]HPX84279.1 SPFH domain-containing protein [Bacilli bacterium]HQC74006.1 SPFH domain-containing protein [Bacilli bacterium]